jgi:hypothetical protein
MWRNALPEDHFSGEPGFCPGDFVLLLCEEFGKSWIPMQYKPLHQPGVVQFARPVCCGTFITFHIFTDSPSLVCAWTDTNNTACRLKA